MSEPLHALGHAILVLLYTSGVAWILFNGPRLFGKVTSFWGPLGFLMLFVVSATIVGTLVLGRPILLYLEGKKNEALRFFGYTVAWLVILTMIVFLTRLWG
jgi:heme O synthase-like polyprenyltransferase